MQFSYDPFGRRVKKSSGAGTSIYAYDGINLIEETNAAGGVVARYAQSENVDEPLAMLRSSTTSYYQADGIGSVTSLSNTSGALAQTYTFDSFGEQTASSGSLTNTFRYTAREFDAETSLYYYRARYYDPNAGRLVREDPIAFKGGINFYRYARNNPVNLVDPFGLGPWGQGIGAVGGGIVGGILGFGGGTAVGTFVAPGVGTVGGAIGGTVEGATEGAVIGAAIGVAIGDLIEDLSKSWRKPKCDKKGIKCTYAGEVADPHPYAKFKFCFYNCSDGIPRTLVRYLYEPCPPRWEFPL